MLRKMVFAFGLVLSAWAMTLPPSAQAQQVGKVYRIGVLSFTTFENTTLAAVMIEGLGRLGYVVGRNIVVELWKAFFLARGLMCYGPDLRQTVELALPYVDKILKGANPGDLPVQQPTTFKLYVNTMTANALGLTIPQSLLQRAEDKI